MQAPQAIPGQLSVLEQGKVKLVSFEEGSKHPWKDKTDALVSRAEALGLEPEWMRFRFEMFQANLLTLEGMRPHVYESIDAELKGLERAAKKTASESKRLAKANQPKPPRNFEDCPGPIALPGYCPRPYGDGTYTHVSSIDHQSDDADESDQERLFKWLELFDLRAVGFTHWGAMNVPRTKTNLYKLQEKMAMLARQKRKQGTLNEVKKVPNLFANTKKQEAKPLFTPMKKTEEGNIVTEDGEVIKATDRIETMERQLENERISKEGDDIRERLGLTNVPKIVHREHAQAVLKKRSAILNELALVMQQFEIIKNRLESDIRDLDGLYGPALETFRRNNPPESGKTLSLLYGDLVLRNAPIYVSADEERDKEMQQWLKNLDDDKKAQFQVTPLPERWRYDASALAVYVKAYIEKNKKAPPIPVRITEAVEDKFFISPSLETFKTKQKEAIKKAADI